MVDFRNLQSRLEPLTLTDLRIISMETLGHVYRVWRQQEFVSDRAVHDLFIPRMQSSGFYINLLVMLLAQVQVICWKPLVGLSLKYFSSLLL